MAQELWWDCDKDGCFNEKKRLRFSAFDGCFPGRIGPTDVDGLVEINSNFLLLEWKPSRYISRGQQLCFERLTLLGPIQVVVVVGDTETMTCSAFVVFRHGKKGKWRASNFEQLKVAVAAWAKRCS